MTAADSLASPVRSVCEHAWITESAHATSEGRIRYVRCVRCAARRVEFEASAVPPTPLSRPFLPTSDSRGPLHRCAAGVGAVSAARVTVDG